jgi:biotin transport system substrate-specific component
MKRNASPARDLTAAALLAALAAVSSFMAIHVGPVPITLQMLFVLLAALILRPVWAAVSMLVYVLLGAIGLPVFAGGMGGIGVLFGPTGGFLFGFIAGAAIGSFARFAVQRTRAPQVVADAAAVVTTIAVVYALGIAQLMVVTHVGGSGLSLVQALLVGAAPFVLPDALKGVLAIAVAQALRRTGVVPVTGPSDALETEPASS